MFLKNRTEIPGPHFQENFLQSLRGVFEDDGILLRCHANVTPEIFAELACDEIVGEEHSGSCKRIAKLAVRISDEFIRKELGTAPGCHNINDGSFDGMYDLSFVFYFQKWCGALSIGDATVRSVVKKSANFVPGCSEDNGM